MFKLFNYKNILDVKLGVTSQSRYLIATPNKD